MGEEQEPSSPETGQIDNLPDQLGLVRTPEMLELRLSAVAAMKANDYDAIGALLKQYRTALEPQLETMRGDQYAKIQIGLIIDTGLMWKEAEKPESYAAELWNAANYASNRKFDELTQLLNTTMSLVEQQISESAELSQTDLNGEEIIAICKAKFPAEIHEELELIDPSLTIDELLEEIAALMYGYDLGEPYLFFQEAGWLDVLPTNKTKE